MYACGDFTNSVQYGSLKANAPGGEFPSNPAVCSRGGQPEMSGALHSPFLEDLGGVVNSFHVTIGFGWLDTLNCC